MRIVMSCGHFIQEAPERYQQYVGTGTTFDCPECGSEQVMKGEIVEFKSQSFHQWMHDESVKRGDEHIWPADGNNTGVIDIPAE